MKLYSVQIDNRLKKILDISQKMETTGRLVSSIYCGENLVYLINRDSSLLLRFELDKIKFEKPLRFRASDYEGDNLVIDSNGRINFISKTKEFVKKRIVPDRLHDDFSHVDSLFKKYVREMKSDNEFRLDKSILEMLDDGLGHVEISFKDKKLKIIQRNVYSGDVVVLERREVGLLRKKDIIRREGVVVGVRTNDFYSIFEYQGNVDFRLDFEGGFCFIEGENKNVKMKGVIANCTYDGIGDT